MCGRECVMHGRNLAMPKAGRVKQMSMDQDRVTPFHADPRGRRRSNSSARMRCQFSQSWEQAGQTLCAGARFVALVVHTLSVHRPIKYITLDRDAMGFADESSRRARAVP